MRRSTAQGPDGETCVGLSLLEPALFQEDPADGHRRARAVQIRHEGLADLRVGRQLAEVHPTHPAGRDVPDQERPPNKPPVPQECDQLVSGARGCLCEGRRGAVRFMIADCSITPLADRRPTIPFGGSKAEIVLGADVQAARAEQPPPLLEIDKVPPRIVVKPLLRALKAAFRAVGSLCNGQHVQDGPPLPVPALLPRWAGRPL